MDLEPVGSLFDADKLKAKLQKKFPDYNFDVPTNERPTNTRPSY